VSPFALLYLVVLAVVGISSGVMHLRRGGSILSAAADIASTGGLIVLVAAGLWMPAAEAVGKWGLPVFVSVAGWERHSTQRDFPLVLSELAQQSEEVQRAGRGCAVSLLVAYYAPAAFLAVRGVASAWHEAKP
jgi:hypothetical protein